jgi:hypothetical protein
MMNGMFGIDRKVVPLQGTVVVVAVTQGNPASRVTLGWGVKRLRRRAAKHHNNCVSSRTANWRNATRWTENILSGINHDSAAVSTCNSRPKLRMTDSVSTVHLSQIGQIAVNVRDLERAVTFYQQTLGMTPLFRMPTMAFLRDTEGNLIGLMSEVRGYA